MDKSKYYMESNYIEQMVEHAFISEVIQEVWFEHKMKVEVLRSEIDSYGYDIVMECNGITRHIQLKTSISGGSTKEQKLNISLVNKPSGCIVWIIREEDYNKKEFKFKYLFFGGNPNEKMPDINTLKISKNTKANSMGVKTERLNIRVVPKSKFSSLNTIEELVNKLFYKNS